MFLTNSIPLRPHHGMCLAYFKGEGYSDGFSAHMQEMLDIFEKRERRYSFMQTQTKSVLRVLIMKKDVVHLFRWLRNMIRQCWNFAVWKMDR